jgi:hypothetical protein
MKIMTFSILIIILGFIPHGFADNNIKVSQLNEIKIDDYDLDYSLMANEERAQRMESNDFKEDYEYLLKAKFKLISGDLKMAKFYLARLNDLTTKLLPVKKRYLGLISFIEGDFKHSLSYLNDTKKNDAKLFSQICLLRLVNLMALNQNDEIRNEANTCMSYTQKFSKNDQLWLDTMVALKTKNFDRVKKNLLTDVEYTLNDDEMSRVWLKTGLFVNKESELLKVLAAIPESSYQSKKIREIIALMYLRRGEKEKALMFVDDIDSANAENIKGNINLQNKEYELAFGHFKLALQKKNDSENSLERAIPLSWILNQFEDGASMLKKVSYRKNLDPRKVDAINIAFLIRLKKFEVAQKELLILKNKFQNVPPFEVNIMDNYVNLLLSDNTVNKVKFDKRKMEDSTDEACKSFDGLSCWMGLSQLMWDNLGRTIKRDDEIYSDKNLTLETMKTKKEINPLKETITIDQKDIEELDSEAVQIN